MPQIILKDGFRYDLFVTDFIAFISKQVKSTKELGTEWGVIPSVLSGIKTGRLKTLGKKTLEKITKGIGANYEFYCEK